MRYQRKITRATLAAMAVTACIGTGTASATILELGGVEEPTGINITASIKTGGTAILRDTFGFFANTCDRSHVAGKTEIKLDDKPTGEISKLTFESCDHTVTVHKPGNLWIEWTSGTNGLVYSEEAEVTTYSTIHGTHVNCTTGAGTLLGTLTGVKTGEAVIDISSTLTCAPHLHSTRWTGTYHVTNPSGLGVTP